MLFYFNIINSKLISKRFWTFLIKKIQTFWIPCSNPREELWKKYWIINGINKLDLLTSQDQYYTLVSNILWSNYQTSKEMTQKSGYNLSNLSFPHHFIINGQKINKSFDPKVHHWPLDYNDIMSTIAKFCIVIAQKYHFDFLND